MYMYMYMYMPSFIAKYCDLRDCMPVCLSVCLSARAADLVLVVGCVNVSVCRACVNCQCIVRWDGELLRVYLNEKCNHYQNTSL